MSAETAHPTRTLASFVAGLRYDDLPSEVRTHAKLVLLDALGCAIYGAAQPWSKIVTRTLVTLEPGGASSIWGGGDRCSAPSAALANGTMIQGYELDDYHAASFLHCGAAAAPAAIAVAEHLAARAPLPQSPTGITGRRLLTALVAAFEVGPRIGLAMGGSALMLNGWHAGAVVGPFLAAAAASSLLGLDADRATHALGIAGTQSAGLGAVHFGSMAKRVHHGFAARNGTLAALLAENGLTGIANVLESEYGGFGVNFAGGRPDGFQPNRAVAGLGAEWETLRVGFKPYACVGVAHTALDALKALRRQQPLPASEVARVVVSGSKALVEHGGWRYTPRDVTSAQMNIGYSVAALLAEGDCFVDQFTPAKIADPSLVDLAQRVEVVEDPDVQALGGSHPNAANVAVYLRDGQVLRQQAIHPWGSDRNPLTADEVRAKYHKLADPVVGDAHAARLESLVHDLDDLANLTPLTAALTWRSEAGGSLSPPSPTSTQ